MTKNSEVEGKHEEKSENPIELLLFNGKSSYDLNFFRYLFIYLFFCSPLIKKREFA